MGCCSEDSDTRARAGSYLAGLMFGIGWWSFIDAAAYATQDEQTLNINFVRSLPGIGTTLALFGINSMDWGALTADSMTYHGDNVACKARTFVLFCIAVSLASLVGSIVILAQDYVDTDGSPWPGIAVFLQATLIFFATFIMKLLTAEG